MNCLIRQFASPQRPLALAAALPLLAIAVGAPATEAPDFNLLDLRGHNHQLQRAGGSAVVLFFTGTGCPIARKCAPKLKELRQRFGKDGVSVWIVNSYPGDSTDDCAKECGELGLWGMTYLRDPKQAVALAFGVQRTAEVVALSAKDWQVFYHGAIDDQYGEGAERPKPQNRILERALEEFLKGQPVTTASSKGHGCLFAFARGAETPSYAKEVAPLLRQHCAQCHRKGGIGPWSMSSYERVRNYSRMIEEVLLTRRMPPWDPDPDFGRFSNAHVLTREETQTLLSWAQAGSPRGEGADPLTEPLPPVPDWPVSDLRQSRRLVNCEPLKAG